MLWRVRNSRGTERFCLSEITGQSSGQKTKGKKTTIKHKANGEENERGAERGSTGALGSAGARSARAGRAAQYNRRWTGGASGVENDKRGGLGAPLEGLFWKVAGSLKTPAPMRRDARQIRMFRTSCESVRFWPLADVHSKDGV